MKIVLNISGMSCAACSSAIEKSLSRKKFIHKISVDLINKKAVVLFDEKSSNAQDIIKLIEKMGYGAQIYRQNDLESAYKESSKQTIIALILAAILFFISMGSMGFSLQYNAQILICVLEIIILLPIIYIYRGIFLRGFRLMFKSPNMDSLVALGSVGAIIYSFYALFLNNPLHSVYFESAGVILAIIGLGKKIEHSITKRAKSGLDSLLNLAPKNALKEIDGKKVLVGVDSICVGDVLILEKGAMLGIDSTLLSESAIIDTSTISGESRPKYANKNDFIPSGSINLGEQIRLNALKTASQSMIAVIINLASDVKKAAISRVADNVASIFVPSVMILAFIASISWLIARGNVEFSFVIFASTLLISCPCALGIATPLSLFISTLIASKNAFYFRDGASLEAASKIDCVVFDKTGTLTNGDIEILEACVYPPFLREYILDLVWCLENESEHLIAKAIKKYIKPSKKYAISEVETISGCGIQAKIDNKILKIGSQDWLKSAIETEHSISVIEINGALAGYFIFRDSLRKNAKNAVENLKNMGIKSLILSGDTQNRVESVAKSCGIMEFYSQMLPQDKLKFIEKLQESGARVAFVGDGINDILALKKANLSISMLSSNDIALCTADLILLENNLDLIARGLILAKKTLRNIKQNLTFAFIYNISFIPVAMGIPLIFGLNFMLNPMIAAIAMGASSLSVVLNAMRLMRIKLH